MATSVSYASATWTALGSPVHLLVHPEPAGAAAATRAAEVLAEVDRSCSRFRADSDLSRVNQNAGRRTGVGPTLREALKVALAAARTTRGLVDPTLGLVLSGLGYDRNYPDLRRSGTAAGPAAVPLPSTPGSWRDVELTDDAVRIPFGRALDLGATGKAFASDLVARTLVEELGVDVMVGIGGDVAIGGPGDHPWQVVVCETPDQTATTLGQLAPLGDLDELVVLSRGGITTSSVVWRRWRQGDQERHHLLDPRTGAPARPVWRTATVIAADCAAANAASTAAVILGDEAVGWLAEQGLAARLVRNDGRVEHVGAWPAVPAGAATA